MPDPSGALIAVFWDITNGLDQIWKSNPERTAWTNKAEYPAEGNISNCWGCSVHGDVVIIAPYANKPVPAIGRARLSRDAGETCTVVYASPDPTMGGGNDQWHYHDVTYDPYQHTIWVSNGDDYPRAGLRYSEDWGATWRDAWTPGGDNTTQPTTVHPLPDMVLLGSDQAQFRFHRMVCHPAYTANQGGAGHGWTLETAAAYSPPGTWLEATYRGHQYAHVGAVYAGLGSNGVHRLIGTWDGVRFTCTRAPCLAPSARCWGARRAAGWRCSLSWKGDSRC